MPSINYTKIAKDYKNPKDGFIELEKQLGRVPNSNESASLSQAYLNISGDSGDSNNKQPRKKGGISYIEALESKPEIGKIADTEKMTLKPFLDATKKLDVPKLLKEAQEDILEQLKLESQLRTDINEKIGISGDLSRGLRNELLDSYPTAIQFGFGISDVTGMIQKMMETSGRFNLISRETIDKTYATARAFVGNLDEMGVLFNEFEKVGLGARGAMESVDKAGKGSLELGLRAKTTVTDIRNNIEKLNAYGFQNGIQGLAEMSRKATEFRMKMDEAFKIADNVMDPEKALSLTANLQVLGGAIGDFNDPLKLMYMATNNVEGLQDALIGAAGSLATYNSEQGRFEITGVNLRRAKEMAKELGVQYEELAKGAIAAQERQSAAMDLAGKGFDIKKEDKEFITNLSRMDKGKMVIEIPQSLQQRFEGESQVALSDLTKSQIDVLMENRKAFEKMSPTDIAKDQLTEITNIKLFLQSWAKGQVREIAGAANGEVNIDRQMKPIYNLIEQYGKENKLDRRKISEVAGNVRNEVLESYMNSGMGGSNDVINKLLDQWKEKVKQNTKDIEKEKNESKKSTASTDISPQNFNLKSNIDVRFPFGFGIPTAEQKGSYLIPT